MSIQSLILATLAISALGANLKGTTKQGVEIATADRLIQYDQVVDMTNKDCQNFDSRSGWKIVMGENIDYFKPKAGETLCSALQSTNKFLWSATQNGCIYNNIGHSITSQCSFQCTCDSNIRHSLCNIYPCTFCNRLSCNCYCPFVVTYCNIIPICMTISRTVSKIKKATQEQCSCKL